MWMSIPIWAPARDLVRAPVLVRDLALALTWPPQAPATVLAPVLVREMRRPPTRLPWIMCRPPARGMLPARPRPTRPMRIRRRFLAWRLVRALALARALVRVLVTVRVLALVRPILRLLVRVLVMARVLVRVLAQVRVLALALDLPMLLVRALVRVLALARVLVLVLVRVLAGAVDRMASILVRIFRTWHRTLDLSTGISLRSSGCPISAAR